MTDAPFRACDNCGRRMTPFMPRQRAHDGRMMCPMCAQNQPRTAHVDDYIHPHEQWQHDMFGCYHVSNGRRLPTHTAALLGPQEQEQRLRDFEAKDPYRAQHHAPFEPNPEMVAGSRSYASLMHLGDPHAHPYGGVHTNVGNIRDIGRTYDALPEFDRHALPSFDAMKHEVNSQYHHLTNTMGINVQPVDHDPYTNVHEMHHDLLNNKRLKVLKTAVTGEHPFFSNDENDRFRAVHDAFGHAATGRGFDAHGEEAAWMAHSRMFTKHALPALTSETRGQNASLHLNGDFGPQRIALLPQHLWIPPHTAAKTAADWHEYRRLQDAQQRRYERAGVGGGQAEHDEYFGKGEYRGGGTERKLTPQDWMTWSKQPTFDDLPADEHEWHRGWDMGYGHGKDAANADFDQLDSEVAQSAHPQKFQDGYSEGLRSAVSSYTATVGEEADLGYSEWRPPTTGREQPKSEQAPRKPKPPKRLYQGNPGSWPYNENNTTMGFDPNDKERWGQNHVPMHTMSLLAVRSDGHIKIIAHDSGSVEVIYHCPFCGSGQVIARSDGTVMCEFCNAAFTVQVQPEFSAFPQTIDGQPVQIPGLPADSNQDAGGMPPEEGDDNPFADDADPNDTEENGPPEDGEDTEDEPIDSGGNPLFNKHSSRSRMAMGPMRRYMPLPLTDENDHTVLYHGSRQSFKPGDMLEAGKAKNQHRSFHADHIYFTHDPQQATRYAGNGGHVYTVQPTGEYGDDPMSLGGYRTQHPVRVTGEVPLARAKEGGGPALDGPFGPQHGEHYIGRDKNYDRDMQHAEKMWYDSSLKTEMATQYGYGPRPRPLPSTDNAGHTVLYHGTQHDFTRGDAISPGGGTSKNRTFHGGYVYFTHSPSEATRWAGKNGRVYTVMPSGPFGDDPMTTDSYRSKHPVIVTGEVPYERARNGGGSSTYARDQHGPHYFGQDDEYRKDLDDSDRLWYDSGLHTASGAILSPLEYIRHLALSITDDRDALIARMRLERSGVIHD